MSQKRIRIVEVGPRDGLQNEKKNIPVEDKVAFIDRLSDSGLSVIEVGAFVHPQWVPQMAGTAEVFAGIKKKPEVSYPVLIPNRTGLERALEVGVRDIAVFTAPSESFTQKNTHCSVEESFTRISELMEVALAQSLKVRGYVSTAFMCPYEGVIDPARVLPVVKRLFDLGCVEISIGDTIGKATPDSVRKLLNLLLPCCEVSRLAMHFHDTYHNALSNIETSLGMGITTFDASVSGLGGCPYAPGASGNVSTESVLQWLSEHGFETGVSLPVIREAATFIRSCLS